MTALIPIAALTGALLVAGVLLLVAGMRRTVRPVRPTRSGAGLAATWARLSRRPAGAPGRRRDVLLGVGVVGGVIAFAATGWLLALVVVPAAVVGLPVLLASPPNRDIELLEALDRWVRTLAATLPTGKSIADAIRTSRRTAPRLLADQVNLLVARLDDRWTSRDALLAFADALDSPDADAIVAALTLAAHRGGLGATATLTALSDSIQDRLKALREIEAERSKPRIVVRQITVITVVVLAIAMVVGRQFFEPYGTPVGQAILAVLMACYIGSLVVLRRMTDPRRRERILYRAGTEPVR